MDDLIGYEDLYSINHVGRIWSKRWSRFIKPQLVKGCHLVNLTDSNGRKLKNVHHLVARQYLPNPYAARTVRHLNDVRIDNRVGNLQWRIPNRKANKAAPLCSACGELGHKKNNDICPIKAVHIEKLQRMIEKEVLESPITRPKEEIFSHVALETNESDARIKKLYGLIPPERWLKREPTPQDCRVVLEDVTECCHCSKLLHNVQPTTFRKWKDHDICDLCWIGHEDERDQLWKKINEYTEMRCAICDEKKTHRAQRFPFDHINMYDKEASIYTLVCAGSDWETIRTQLDKCQRLCQRCHHAVTKMENLLALTRIKQILTRSFNNGDIDEDEHTRRKEEMQAKYATQMANIYDMLRTLLCHYNRPNLPPPCISHELQRKPPTSPHLSSRPEET